MCWRSATIAGDSVKIVAAFCQYPEFSGVDAPIAESFGGLPDPIFHRWESAGRSNKLGIASSMMLQLFQEPVFPDPEQTRQARVLRALLLAAMVAFSAGPALLLLVMPEQSARWLAVFLAIEVPVLGLLWLNRRGRVRFASVSTVVALSVIALGFSLTAGGVRAPGVIGGYIVIVLFAGVLLGQRASILTAALLGIAGLGLIDLEASGLLPAPAIVHTPITWWLTTMTFVGIAVGVMRLYVASIRGALDRARAELADRTRVERALR